jgi:hypothetical protein
MPAKKLEFFLALASLLLPVCLGAQQNQTINARFRKTSGGSGSVTCVQGGQDTGSVICPNSSGNGYIKFNGATSPQTLTLASNVTAGHVVLVLVGNSATTPCPTGVTGGSDTLTIVGTCKVDAGSPNYGVAAYEICSSAGGYNSLSIALSTGTGNYGYAVAFELAGSTSSGCSSSAEANGTGTSVSPGTLTPSGGTSFVASMAENNNTNAMTLNWAGATAQGTGQYTNYAAAIRSAAAQTPDWTITSSGWAAIGVSVNP